MQLAKQDPAPKATNMDMHNANDAALVVQQERS
jgi:hypothetical protein